MAIATPKENLYSDQASIDELLEKVAAKVRAQLEKEVLSISAGAESIQAVESEATQIKAAELIAAEPEDSEPEVVEPEAPESKVFEPEAPESKVFESKVSESKVSESKVSEPLSQPAAPQRELAGVSSLQQLAAEGSFQAIAYWLNERLVPHNVYAQVLADEVPGRLKVLIEFERAPHADRLTRFVCDRLYKLNSDVIEGVHLIVRALGAADTDWEKSIRIPTATERLRRTASVLTTDSAAASTTQIHESSRAQQARQVVQGQFKFFRAALVCGSAIAAFFFGTLTEFILSDRLSVASVDQSTDQAVDPTGDTENSDLPWYGKSADLDFSQATEVSFRPASRFKGKTVEAALETVAVVPHNTVADPSDPTITLLFGGDMSLKDFVFEKASDVDQLFSEIDIYQQADVAMVGLSEPLAYASTSLQEDFHHRTRPQAAKALEAGGIDIVGLASEGTMTYGERGLAETLNNLDRQGIFRVGAGRNQQEAHRPEILEVKGQRIAYLGYNPDALKGADFEKAGVATASSDTRKHIVEDIRAIRSQVDWVVVNYRWGDALDLTEAEILAAAESETSETAESAAKKRLTAAPEDWQKTFAHEAVDAGADLVVGYHPSQIQGTEIYRDRAIAYSLGDFSFDSTSTEKHDTTALKVSLRNQQMKVEFLPLTIQDSKLKMATGEHGAEILQTIRKSSKTLANPLRFPAVLKPAPAPTAPSVVSPPFNDNTSDNTNDNIQGLDSSEPTVEPATIEPAIIEPAVEQDALQQPDIGQSESSAPAPDPMMREPDALFMPKANEEDLSQQSEALRNSLQDETLLETWGEKKADSEPEFTPILEGTLERQQLGDEPERSPLENLEGSAKGDSVEADSVEADSVEADSVEADSAEADSTKDYLESELESNSAQPWEDPFAQVEFESTPAQLPLSTDPVRVE